MISITKKEIDDLIKKKAKKLLYIQFDKHDRDIANPWFLISHHFKDYKFWRCGSGTMFILVKTEAELKDILRDFRGKKLLERARITNAELFEFDIKSLKTHSYKVGNNGNANEGRKA